MAGVYVSSLLVIGASLILGAAIMSICGGGRPGWLAGAVGNAALLVLAMMAIRLPGGWITALVVLIAATLGAAGAAYRGHGLAFPAVTPAALLVAAIPLALVSLPFLAAGHFGPLGVGLDDDLGFHVGWVQQLHAGHPPFGLTPGAYPLGQESLAAVLSGLSGGAEPALVGVGAATLPLTALAALDALERPAALVRVLGAAAVGIPYLSAAYFGEGSFKEPGMAMLVLAFALLCVPVGVAGLRPRAGGVPGGTPERWRPRTRLRGAVPLVVLALGMFVTLGPAGLGYPAAILAVRAVADAVRSGRLGWTPRTWAVVGGAVAACLLVAGIVYAALPHRGVGGLFVHGNGTAGGNLIRQLPLTEAAGAWPGGDFRVALSAATLPAVPVAVAVAGFLAALVVVLRRQERPLLLPVATVVGVALILRPLVIPYDSVKALVIAGPLVVLFTVASLAWRPARDPPAWTTWAGSAAACAVSVTVLWSSAHVLWSSPVDSGSLDAQLTAMQPLVAGHTVLFLGRDDWVQTALPKSRVELVVPYGGQLHAPLPIRPQKAHDGPFDFDSEPVAGLDRVDFVITTATLDASAPPPNFRPVRRTADYVLWARTGPTPPRDVLAEGGQPGATLNCGVAAAAALASGRGVAAVRPAPLSGSAWRFPSGALAAGDGRGYLFAPPGSLLMSDITLAPGRWQLSLDYQSANPITVTAGSASARLPERLEPVGMLWPVVDVQGTDAPVHVELDVARGHTPASVPGALVGLPVAVPADERDLLIPLRAACGRYVDWYRYA